MKNLDKERNAVESSCAEPNRRSCGVAQATGISAQSCVAQRLHVVTRMTDIALVVENLQLRTGRGSLCNLLNQY